MRLVLVSTLVASTLTAQGMVPPYVLQVTNPHANLSAPVVPATAHPGVARA